MIDATARVSIIQSMLHMHPLSSTLPFPIFTCRSPSEEMYLSLKKDCLLQLLVRKIWVIINFYAGTGGTGQCKTYVKPVMIPFSDRPAQHYFYWLHGEHPLKTRGQLLYEHEYTVIYSNIYERIMSITTVTKGAIKH